MENFKLIKNFNKEDQLLTIEIYDLNFNQKQSLFKLQIDVTDMINNFNKKINDVEKYSNDPVFNNVFIGKPGKNLFWINDIQINNVYFTYNYSMCSFNVKTNEAEEILEIENEIIFNDLIGESLNISKNVEINIITNTLWQYLNNYIDFSLNFLDTIKHLSQEEIDQLIHLNTKLNVMKIFKMHWTNCIHEINPEFILSKTNDEIIHLFDELKTYYDFEDNHVPIHYIGYIAKNNPDMLNTMLGNNAIAMVNGEIYGNLNQKNEDEDDKYILN